MPAPRKLPDAARPYMFQKGQSGNPKGKAKGKTMKTIIREMMAMKAPEALLSKGADVYDAFKTNGKPLTNKQALAIAWIRNAMLEFDQRAIESLNAHLIDQEEADGGTSGKVTLPDTMFERWKPEDDQQTDNGEALTEGDAQT